MDSGVSWLPLTRELRCKAWNEAALTLATSFRRSAARQAEGETLTNPQALRDEGPEKTCFGSWLRLCSERTPLPKYQLFAFEAQRPSSAACMEWRSHGMQVGCSAWLGHEVSGRGRAFMTPSPATLPPATEALNGLRRFMAATDAGIALQGLE